MTNEHIRHPSQSRAWVGLMSRRRWKTLVLIPILCWGLTDARVSIDWAAASASQTGSCEETVTALRGRVGFVPDLELPGVGFHVALYTPDWTHIVRRTRTGRDGSFDFGSVPTGTYYLRYWKRGFMGYRVVVCVDPDATHTLAHKTEAL